MRRQWSAAAVWLLVIYTWLAAGPALAQTAVTLKLGGLTKDPGLSVDSFLFGNAVFDPSKGAIRLAGSVLLTDELGATDYHQSEALSDQVQAKKIFVLEGSDQKTAELFFYGSAKDITVNGKPLPPAKQLISTGWSRAVI